MPLFILGFIAAAMIRTSFPDQVGLRGVLAFAARRLLVLTLFLIGAGLNRKMLKDVGMPVFQGIALWIIVSLATYAAIDRGILR